MKNNMETEIIVLNPTLELSLKNINKRKIETGRDVIKSEVVEKYADIYLNIQKLFEYLKSSFPELRSKEYPIPFQIYNKETNVPKDLEVSYDLKDLQHGSRDEVSNKYDEIIKRFNQIDVERI